MAQIFLLESFFSSLARADTLNQGGVRDEEGGKDDPGILPGDRRNIIFTIDMTILKTLF